MWRTTCSSSDTSFFTGVVEQARVDFAVWQCRMVLRCCLLLVVSFCISVSVFEVVS